METADRRVPTGGEQDPIGMDRRSRRAFTASLLVVVVVVIIALGYSWFRDPGPQPTYPPKISGTEDGALKRAIVHYMGALESGKVDVMTDVMDDDSPRGKALAAIAIEEFRDSTDGEATAVVRATEFGCCPIVTITFADGTEHQVDFTSSGPGDPWAPTPRTDRPLPEAETGDGPQPTTPRAAPNP